MSKYFDQSISIRCSDFISRSIRLFAAMAADKLSDGSPGRLGDDCALLCASNTKARTNPARKVLNPLLHMAFTFRRDHATDDSLAISSTIDLINMSDANSSVPCFIAKLRSFLPT